MPVSFFDTSVTLLYETQYEAGGEPAYWPWLRAVRPHLEISTRQQLAADWGALADVASVLLPELAARIPNVRPFHATLDSGQYVRSRFLDALAAYLVSVSPR